MARFDVYPNPNPNPAAAAIPYLLDVQSDLLDDLQSRVVVPLRLADRSPAAKIQGSLMPMLVVAGVECVLETPKLAAVPKRILKSPLTNLAAHRDVITRALDFLFQGY